MIGALSGPPGCPKVSTCAHSIGVMPCGAAARMAKQPTRLPKGDTPAPRARRLTAEARKSSILKAARRAFIETGDVNGTTIKTIAERGASAKG